MAKPVMSPPTKAVVPTSPCTPGDGSTGIAGTPGRLPARALALLTSHLVVALVALVAIGGATRVMEAGLACPDWPLCYGVLLPGRQMNLQVFLEWFHRLDAFVVGVALLVLFGLSLRFRDLLPRWLPWSAGGALALVAFQGALGALTVIRLLASGTVTAHLATALLLVMLVSGIHQALERNGTGATSPAASPTQATSPPPWWWIALISAGTLVLAQCLLGGLMASRWAADRCFSAGEACRWLWFHRLGAWPASIGVLSLAAASLALPSARRDLQAFSAGAAGLLLLQVALGVATLRLQLSVPAVTVAHQLVAALLVAVIGALAGRALPIGTVQPSSAPEALHG